MAVGNYTRLGIRSTESTMCTTHVGSAAQLTDACLLTAEELQRSEQRAAQSLRLDRIGNEVHGSGVHRIIERRGEDRFAVSVFHDDDELARRMDLAGASSKARADRAFQSWLRRLTT